jgi:glucokinase
MIIAGDIGGTKTNVALFEADGDRVGRVVAQQSFPSGKHTSLEAIVEEFLAAHRDEEVTSACFGIAGPVVGNRVDATNLAWDVDAEVLAETLKVESVRLINDLEATAYGIEILEHSRLHILSEGDGNWHGHRALIAAGTGLGMAGIYFDGLHYHPMASEGGHADFAPRDEREYELLVYLKEQLNGRVSCERVVSGMGLFNIYSFLRDRKIFEEPAWLADEIAAGDKSAAVSGRAGIAVEALDMFAAAYGAMAGNLALTFKSSGGLYVGGGIAPKIIEKLKDGVFVRNYADKGRMSGLVESIPVRVILDDKTALYGAALCALIGTD